MPTHIAKPAVIEAAGNKPKRIEEFIGRVNSATKDVSIARMKSPAGWVEPGQKPEFDEYTLVLKGMLRVESKDSSGADPEAGSENEAKLTVLDVHAGQAVITHAGEWVRYSSPHSEGAEYVAVCLPAFAPNTVHRDE